jgi:hypothetical protein
MKKLSLVLLLFMCSIAVMAQKDTEFWFAAPEVAQNNSSWLDRNIFIRVTTYGEAANIVISQPALGGMPTQTATVGPNTTQSFDLTTWIGSIENSPANTTKNYGIKIASTNPQTGLGAKISAYYEVVSGANGATPANNPEAFILKGKNALGTAFYIPSQNLVANASGYSPTPYNSFDIVATEDNTLISITPSKDIVGHLAINSTYNITLNKGQTYSATAVSQAANKHLDGSKIVSDKPIAVTVKDDLLIGTAFGGNCADLTGDQIVPINHIGRKYIAIKGLLNSPGDYLFVTATQNNTSIYKDGSATPLATISAGQTYSFPIGSNLSTLVTTSQPAYLWQLSGSGCEFGATILPRIECSGSDSITYRRSSNNQFYINLLVPSGAETSFQIGGVTPGYTMSFSSVPGTSGAWKAARVDLSSFCSQGSVISVINSAAKFHMSAIDINGGGTSYAYLSDYSNITAAAQVTPNPVCIGGNINLFGSGGTTYSWTGPNGFTSNLENPVINNASAVNAGIYKVLVGNGQGCSDSAIVNVSVVECQDSCVINAGYCVDFNNPLTFNFWATGAPAGGSFNWNFGDGSYTTTMTGAASHTYAAPGTYTIVIVYATKKTKCYKKYKICISDIEGGDEKTIGVAKPTNSDLIGDLYPNPANTSINVLIHKQDKESLLKANVTIYSIEGRKIYNSEYAIPDSGVLNIPTGNFTTGTYLCEVKVGENKAVRKFVKL